MGANGINKLATVINERMKRITGKFDNPVLDFGIIQDDYSLITTAYQIKIPKEDYFVLRQLTLGDTDDVLTKTKQNQGSHKHSSLNLNGMAAACYVTGAPVSVSISGSIGEDGNHVHDVLIPEKMRWLKPADKVLVAWVGNDAVVIDIVYPATEIG